jgi:hypothetical protein
MIFLCRRAVKSSQASPILSWDRDSDNLLISVCVVFSSMLTHPFKSFSPIKADGLQVVQDQLVPSPVNGGHHFFNRLKHPILDFLLQNSEWPKVSRTQVWRIRWVGNGVKSQIGKFITHLATILVYGIVRVRKNCCPANSAKNSPLYFNNVRSNVLDKIFLSELCTRTQCIHCDQTHTVEEKRQDTS